MKNLTKGANAVLTRSGTVQVNLSWKAARIELDASCFAVTASGKTPGDAWFVFYNQPDSPRGAIRFSQPDAHQARFVVQLDQLPAEVQKCVFAGTLNQSSFHEIADATITATPTQGEALSFKISDVTDEQALIFAEIYRHGPDWKMRAIGQGFKGGLQPLAEHYGIRIADEPPAPPPVPPAPAANERSTPPPVPPVPPTPPPRPRRSGWGRKLIRALVVVLLIAGGSIAGLAYYYPQLLFVISPPLSTLIQPLMPSLDGDSSATPARGTRPVVPVENTCSFTDEQTFDRYHTLGENYIRILKTVDASNQQLARLREELKNIDAACPDAFVQNNHREIEQLEKLPIQGWIEESDRLNVCAGIMIKKVEREIQTESRPTILQRLLKNADRSRNLESDLTNISRDLAYLNNKAERLVKGYRSNREACDK